MGSGADGAGGDGGLHVGESRGWIDGYRQEAYIVCRERLGQRSRVAGGRGRGLKLAARIQQEPARGHIAAGSGVVVKAVLVGTPIVVDDCRSQMVAVAKRRAADG